MINKIKQNFITIMLIFILLVGLSMLSYPTVSDYWNSFHQSKAVAGYVDKVADLSKADYSKMLSDAESYNKTLDQSVIPDLNINGEAKEVYNRLLDVTGSGIMAYVEIPKLNTTLPIYHGTDDAVLQVAIGHIPGTSLPVGGEGTHSVISGHRGLPSAKLFTDLDQLVEGDIFYIQVLDQTLTYEVDQILTVTPDDVSPLTIDPDQDYVTLVTCTPYGVNSHRLLVRGRRIANETKEARVTAEASQVDPILVAPFVAVIVLLFLSVLLYLKGKISP